MIVLSPFAVRANASKVKGFLDLHQKVRLWIIGSS